MNILPETELKSIAGGELTLGLGCLIVGGIVFLIGIIDGYLRPYGCRK